jgi:hypothetical protein
MANMQERWHTAISAAVQGLVIKHRIATYTMHKSSVADEVMEA